MVGQANFSHKELQNKSCNDIQDMIVTQKGINWNDFPIYQKRGSCVVRNKIILESEGVKETCMLRDMNRDIDQTLWYVALAQDLRKCGTKVATNIIIDYVVDGKVIHNMNENWLNDKFDYWFWNPYFDGHWDYQNAEKRFKKYIG